MQWNNTMALRIKLEKITIHRNVHNTLVNEKERYENVTWSLSSCLGHQVGYHRKERETTIT